MMSKSWSIFIAELENYTIISTEKKIQLITIEPSKDLESPSGRYNWGKGKICPLISKKIFILAS